MSARNNILTELKELDSSLSGVSLINTYQVPAGYFDGFTSSMLNLVKAMDAIDAHEELSLLSPVVNDIGRNMPFTIPANYFNDSCLSIVLFLKIQSLFLNCIPANYLN